ncbi:MAG: HlyD family efflux transporter periplasmic adaptor subunit [Bacteroidota bacterium]
MLPVKNTERRLTTMVSGRVIPKYTTQIFAEVQGRVEPTKRPFKSGVAFNKGATLISIDDTEFALNLEAQRAAFLNVLTGMLPDLKSDYADSYEQWLQYVDAYDFGQNLTELPEPKSQEEKFYLTTNQVYNLYYQIKAGEERLTKYTITAPYNATIVTANIDVGGLVSPGQPLGTISDRYRYELEAGVPLQQVEYLKVGDQIPFTSNEIKGEWTGRVTRITSTVDAATQNIIVFFDLRGKGLRAGMYLEGKMDAASTERVTAIPSDAMQRDESVLILQSDVLTRKAVEPIDFLNDSIIVKGLSDNDLLVLNRFEVPAEGMRVGN